jgi:hypothetical protein
MPKEKATVEKTERKSTSLCLVKISTVVQLSAARSTGGGGRKKLSAYNKFMQTEMARLKEDEPEMLHQDR